MEANLFAELNEEICPAVSQLILLLFIIVLLFLVYLFLLILLVILTYISMYLKHFICLLISPRIKRYEKNQQ